MIYNCINYYIKNKKIKKMRIVVTQNGTRIIKELEYLPKHRSHTIEISNISSKNDDENEI